MTNHDDDDDPATLLGRKLRSASPDVSVSGAFPIRADGIQKFMIMTGRLLTTDEMIQLCRELAVAVRRELPERTGGWAAQIFAGNRSATIMGDYFIGWAGRADEWHLREGMGRKATDQAEWLAFRNRLQDAVSAMGIEGDRAGQGGDFKVSDGDDPLKQTLFVNNPEFLTKELIAAIQDVIREGSPDGVVNIFPSFGEPFETLYKGLDIRANSVEEKWDRQEAQRLLGGRLKI